MTVCIAAICSRLQYIIEVSDRLVSSDETSADAVLKMETLVADVPWTVMFAGLPTNYKRLIARIKANLGDGRAPAEIVQAVEEAYRIELLKIHETEVLIPYGMSRDDFFAHGKERFTEYKFNAIVEVLEQTHTGVTLLIAGFDERGDGHLYQVSCWGVVKEQPLEFHAIGKWEQHRVRHALLDSGICPFDLLSGRHLSTVRREICSRKYPYSRKEHLFLRVGARRERDFRAFA